MNVPRRNCDHMISQSEKWCLTCWEPLIRAAVDQARWEAASAADEVLNPLVHDGRRSPIEAVWINEVLRVRLRDAIHVRDKEPRE